MEFEWDPKKSKENKKKHGVSFDEATQIWEGIRIDVPNIAYSKSGENRSATIGLVGGAIYTAIWTKRNKCIRMICVRRARKDEKEAFIEKI